LMVVVNDPTGKTKNKASEWPSLSIICSFAVLKLMIPKRGKPTVTIGKRVQSKTHKRLAKFEALRNLSNTEFFFFFTTTLASLLWIRTSADDRPLMILVVADFVVVATCCVLEEPSVEKRGKNRTNFCCWSPCWNVRLGFCFDVVVRLVPAVTKANVNAKGNEDELGAMVSMHAITKSRKRTEAFRLCSFLYCR